MSIEQANKIDVIGIDKETNEVILTISDHLDWESDNSHLILLQEKINAYLRFIESGEIVESYPNAKNKHPVINVRLLYKPNTTALNFLSEVKRIVENANIGFQFECKIANH